MLEQLKVNSKWTNIENLDELLVKQFEVKSVYRKIFHFEKVAEITNIYLSNCHFSA